MAYSSRLSTTDQDGIRIIRFTDDRLFDDLTVREVGDQLMAALPRRGPARIIIDFTGVESMSSTMLVKLVLLQRRLDGEQGKLRLCELSDVLQAVFRSTNLDRLFAIDRDLAESLANLKTAR